MLATSVLAIAMAGEARAADAQGGELEPGKPAPAFILDGSDGASYSLEALLKAHKGVVLAWFPKAFTPG
jgi:cytosine/adenosine deaminase-related metal-dependent hydrolase